MVKITVIEWSRVWYRHSSFEVSQPYCGIVQLPICCLGICFSCKICFYYAFEIFEWCHLNVSVEDAAHTLMPQVCIYQYKVFKSHGLMVLDIDLEWLGCWVEFGKRRWCHEAEAVMGSKDFHQRIGIFQDSSCSCWKWRYHALFSFYY